MRRLLPTMLVAGLVLVGSEASAAPTVTAIAPSAGNRAGGTPVTVTGTGFLPGATVRIGGVACTQVKVVTSTTIIAVTGANGAGVKRVTVLNTASDSSGTDGLYTYNSRTDLTKTTKAHFEVAGSSRTNVTTTGLDSTLRWTNWTPTTGGSMANGTYYYVVTAVNAAGETQRSVQSPGVTLSGSNNAVQLAWTPISGAIQYKLYRTTTSGSYSSPALIATLSAPSHTDVAASPSSGAPPGTSSATGDLFLARGATPASSFSAGPATTGTIALTSFSLMRPNGTFLVLHGDDQTNTSVYDPVAETMSAGPATTVKVHKDAHGFKRPDGKFLIVVAGDVASTTIYDPVANTMSPGPDLTAIAGLGSHAIKRPDGKFLIVHGKSLTTTTIYDPVANTMAPGPAMSDVVEKGGFGALPRPDGKFLIVHGKDGSVTSIYDAVADTMLAGPATTGNVGLGGHAVQRPNGTFLIVHARNSTTTSIYDPVANTMTAGPTLTSSAKDGAHSIQRADGTFLIVLGAGGNITNIYDAVANTVAAGPSLANNVDVGGHSLQRPDGKYLIINGSGTKTELYDAGWFRTGTYVSEKLNPTDLNWWNTFSWVRDLDDTLTVKIKTASSSAGLDAAAWRTVANGGAVGAGAGETWLQVGVDCARAIPKKSGAQEDVWGRWLAEFRVWLRPDVLSFTVNYTPTTLSVSPSRSTFAFGGQPFNVWVPADSCHLRNDGTAAQTLYGKISTFTDGSNAWTISPTTNGVDHIRAQWSTSSSVGPWTDIAAYSQDFTITNSVAAGDSVKFFLRIQTPTDTPSTLEHASTLTLTAQ